MRLFTNKQIVIALFDSSAQELNDAGAEYWAKSYHLKALLLRC